MTLTQITEKGIKDGEIVNADINTSAAIAGTKISPSFTSDITITNNIPRINFVDSGDNPDWEIGNINGAFRFRDTTNAATWMQINTDGHVDINSNLDVTGNLTVDTNTLYVDSSNNQVGIGTTSPAEKLTLGDGDLKFFHSNAGSAHRTTFIEFGNSSNRITSETNYGSDNSSNYTAGLKFTTKNFNGSSFQTINALNIQANGRVGIGTTSPSQKLTVAYSNGSPWSTSSLGVGMKVENTNAVNGVAAGIELRSFQNSGGASIQFIHAVNDGVSSYGSDLVFSTRVAYTGAYRETARITNAGNLKLHSGIDFSATTNASGVTSNILDDYEEGTFTVSLGGSWNSNPTNLAGAYVKIGRIVHIYVNFSGGSKSSTTSGYLQGLPFATTNYGTGSVVDSNVDNQGNCLFFNTNIIWLTDNSFNSTTYVTGQYTTG